MTSKFRLVEHPKGLWRVQRKRWFGWAEIVFFGRPLIWRTISMSGSFYPPDAIFSFSSEAQAREALRTAIANLSVTTVVEIGG